MSVRIRPGDGEPPRAADHDWAALTREDPDRPRDPSRVRTLFADEDTGSDHDGSDDVASLLGVTRPKRSWLHRDLPWSKLVSLLVVASVAVLVLGGLVYRLSSASAPATSAPAPGPSAPPSSAPTSSASSPPASASAQPADPDAMTAVSWQGAALPVSPVAGPRVFTATRAHGFQHDPLGAALAAVHVATHIDPYTGPRVFRAAIEEQVEDAPQDYLAGTQALYEAAARAHGVSRSAVRAGRPVLAPTGAIQSWRVDDFTPQRATVRLLVVAPTGRRLVYTVPVVWTAGDWSVSLANATPDHPFDVAGAKDVHGFRSFIETRGN